MFPQLPNQTAASKPFGVGLIAGLMSVIAAVFSLIGIFSKTETKKIYPKIGLPLSFLSFSSSFLLLAAANLFACG